MQDSAYTKSSRLNRSRDATGETEAPSATSMSSGQASGITGQSGGLTGVRGDERAASGIDTLRGMGTTGSSKGSMDPAVGDTSFKSHAKPGGSILPEIIQKAVPEKIERMVPNAIHDTGDKKVFEK